MLFAGRPELKLPPAPDTLALLRLRHMLSAIWLVICVLLVGLFAEGVRSGDALGMVWVWNLFFGCVLLLAGLSLAAFYQSERQHYENDFWTPERLRRTYPALWKLYCDGNGSSPQSRVARRRDEW